MLFRHHNPNRIFRSILAGCFWLMVCAAVLRSQGPSQAQQQTSSAVSARPNTPSPDSRVAEFNVKGVFLYNIAKLIEWPASSALKDDAFLIGVVGQSDITRVLKKVATQRSILDQRTQQQLPLKIQEFATADDCEACQLIYISENVPKDQIGPLIERFESLPILFVGEELRFAATQGAAELVLVNGRVSFNLNLNQINHKRLKVDARLLKIANEIYKEPVVSSASQD